MKLHFCSSFSIWMIFHGISCLLCLLMNQYSLTNWWKFLHSLLSLFLLLKYFLAWWPSLFSHSLMLFPNLISPWWFFFSSFLAWWGWTIPFLWWNLFSKLDELFIFSSLFSLPPLSLFTHFTNLHFLPHYTISSLKITFPSFFTFLSSIFVFLTTFATNPFFETHLQTSIFCIDNGIFQETIFSHS